MLFGAPYHTPQSSPIRGCEGPYPGRPSVISHVLYIQSNYRIRLGICPFPPSTPPFTIWRSCVVHAPSQMTGHWILNVSTFNPFFYNKFASEPVFISQYICICISTTTYTTNAGALSIRGWGALHRRTISYQSKPLKQTQGFLRSITLFIFCTTFGGFLHQKVNFSSNHIFWVQMGWGSGWGGGL